MTGVWHTTDLPCRHLEHPTFRVERQAVLQVPLSDINGTRGKNRQCCSCVVDTDGAVELRVVSDLVLVLVCDDNSHVAAVDGEQQRPEHKPMRKTPALISTTGD